MDDMLELTELDTDGSESIAQQKQQQSKLRPPEEPNGYILDDDSDNEDEFQFLENQKELVALQRLDDKSAQLQQEGRYTEALEIMEKGLVLRQHFFGAESDEVRASCKTVGEMCNLLAMTYLQQEEFAVVLELLKKAEILTEKHAAGRAVTLNNFACYYRRQGNLHKALGYLTDAIKIETRLENLPNKADTHLNMCAVLSQLGKHQSALSHAQSALILLHEELQLGQPSQNSNNHQHTGQSGATETIKLDRVAVLGIAYHNAGVEQEFLKLCDQSLQSYRKGVDLTSRYLGEAHGIVITLQNSLVTAKRTMSGQIRANRTSGDGISVNHAKKNRFALLKLSLKSTLGGRKPKQQAQPAVATRVRHHGNRVATEG